MNEIQTSNILSVPDVLKVLFKRVDTGDVHGLSEILRGQEFASKTLDVLLNKIFLAYKQGSSYAKEMINEVLKYKADPDLNIKTGKINNGLYTGLMLAAEENDVNLANILVKYHADVNLKDSNGRNCLFYSLKSKNENINEMVNLLMMHEINLNEIDSEGQTVLTIAVNRGNKNLIKMFLENGANFNHQVEKDGNTSMHYAVINNKPEIIKLLLSKKPNLALKNKRGETALDLSATISNRTEVYAILAEEYNRRKEHSSELIETTIETNATVNNYESLKKGLQIERNDSAIFYSQTNKPKNVQEENSSSNATNQNLQNINININNQNNLLHFVKRPNKMRKGTGRTKSIGDKGNPTTRSMNDNVFKFQSNAMSSIEIPISFQQESLNNNKGKVSNQLHTYIKIQKTPTLILDISDESKQDQLMLSCKIDELLLTNLNQGKKINSLESDLSTANEENDRLRMEISRLQEELIKKDSHIQTLTNDFNSKEMELNVKMNEFNTKIEDKNLTLQILLDKYEKMEKELGETKLKEYRPTLSKEISKFFYLEKKFSNSKYEDKYIIKCLQKDLLDFQEYTKTQIKKIKSTHEEILQLIQSAVDECIPDYEVRLYGSHATNLCLQWSDLDLVLVHKRNFNVTNYSLLHNLYVVLLDKPWKKSIKFIDTAMIPLIKLTSSDELNSIQIDISLQDNKHYGLKCVELVKSFMKDYEALEPLLFALKNILKNANLNDPYTGGLSSYGLILMVVSFLQSQQENKKNIKISDGNLGRLFLEFLWYYGLYFDHTKYVIYAFAPNESTNDKDSIAFHYSMQQSHDLIIIDPLNKVNNVARSTYQFINIKMAFMIGFVVSHEECECDCHYSIEENNLYTTDHCILKRIFNSVKRFNSNSGGSI